MVETQKKPNKKTKKSTEKIEKHREFVIVYSQGEKTVFAPSVIEARIQAEEFLIVQGMHPRRDLIDIIEVSA